MTDWYVRDEYGHTYSFPSFALAPESHVKLHTSAGTNTLTDVYWGRTQAVCNNTGDTVYLYDANSQLVHSYSH